MPCSFSARSMRFLSTNSRTSAGSSVSCQVKNSCRTLGTLAQAPAPQACRFVGTTRQPRTENSSSLAMVSIIASAARHSFGSSGRKNMPTAYCPIGGSEKLTVFRKNSSGICTKTPAPSPVSGSDPVPPRCAKRDNISSESCTIACERSPFTCAINPVPHASCSNSGRQSFAFCQVLPARKEEALAVRPVFGATSDSCKSLPRCRGSSALQGCISCCFIFHLLIYTFPKRAVSACSHREVAIVRVRACILQVWLHFSFSMQRPLHAIRNRRSAVRNDTPLLTPRFRTASLSCNRFCINRQFAE